MKTFIEKAKTGIRAHRSAILRVPVVLLTSMAFVFLVPQTAHAAEWWDVVGNIEESICGWLMGMASSCFNMYFGIVGSAANTTYISGTFTELFGSQTVWNFVESTHQTVVIPLAESILALVMLVQLIKISQRIDATATLPAVKDIVFLAVTYVLFHWLIVNSLDIITAIFDLFNNITTSFGSANSSGSPFEGALNMDDVDLSNATIGGCFMLLIFSILSLFVGLLAYIVALVVAMARCVQLYAMAAFAPVPLSLLGFEETRQMGIGFLKNFCAAALAGTVMMFLFVAYPYIITSTVSSIDKDAFVNIVLGGDGLTGIKSLLTWIAMSVLLIFGLVKSGAWAKEILGS